MPFHGPSCKLIWDAETGKELLTLKGHGNRIYSVAFSPDGRRVVTGSSDKTAKIWDAENGKELLILKGHGDRVLSVAFSSDGKRVVTGSNDSIAKIWDAETGMELLTLKGHPGPVGFVTFSPDGRRVVTRSRTVKIWKAVDWTFTREEFEKQEPKCYQAWLKRNEAAPKPSTPPKK